ncbi:ATP-binding protein [uncultured Jannaschia sp.]|uniref:sensor histidine kinase n=1 Tax=uncultured Jannaschia sp. TaxID=293347 RepID=UPI00260C1684|nr:ATP-binding protein [uncultured Jannaschia sp.]
MSRLVLILVTAASAALVAGLVWWMTLGTTLATLEAKGRADLSLAADRLRLELQRTRDLSVLLSDDPRLDAAEALTLQRFADRAGASDVLLLDRSGRVVVSASGAESQRGDRRWFRRAMQGALGIGTTPDGGSFVHAAPIFRGGRVVGVVGVLRDLTVLERGWRAEPQAIYFTDATGGIVLTNREELLAGSVRQDLTPVQGFDVRRVSAGRYVPEQALHLELPLPVLDLTGELLLDIAPARALAQARAVAAAAAVLVLGAILGALWERRRVLARANALLEARVDARTSELREANRRLTAEIGERREAEAALNRAQADLVQAGKLSALGQMSAGISHELNQPLMAIRSFAQNGATFLARGKVDAASANLEKIGQLAHRAGRIIRNLRAFARAEPEPAVVTDLSAVIEAALDITETRRREAGIETRLDLAPGPVLAMGGEVRLGQVVVNLISNAVDAMAGRDGAVMTVELATAPPRIVVRDTGPGLESPEHIFDPFYTTKEVGEGLGLGLSISYGIVSGFGGTIRGRNTDTGAEFEVALPPAPAAEVAA